MNRRVEKGPSDAWYIYRLKVGSLLPGMYALVFYGETEIVLNQRGLIITFRRINQAPSIVQQFASRDTRRCPFGSYRVSLTCDFAELAQFVMRRRKDQHSKLLNSLNTLLELIDATKLQFPKLYEKSLCALADHVTFSDDIAMFFSSSACSRQQILDAVLWGVGAVCTRTLAV